MTKLDLQIRQEQESDYKAVESVVESAFRSMKYSEQTEHLIVNRLRNSSAFVPELSLVALLDQTIIGHILISKVLVKNKDAQFEILSLAPVSVNPSFQLRGVGTALIERAHEIAKSLDYKAIVLIGHKDYYPKFGYVQSDQFGISFPFDSAAENCLVKELKTGALENISGCVQYPKEFME